MHVHWGGGLQYDTTRQLMGLVADMQGAVMLTVVIWVVHGYVICIQQSTGCGGTYTTINRGADTTSTMGSD